MSVIELAKILQESHGLYKEIFLKIIEILDAINERIDELESKI